MWALLFNRIFNIYTFQLIYNIYFWKLMLQYYLRMYTITQARREGGRGRKKFPGPQVSWGPPRYSWKPWAYYSQGEEFEKSRPTHPFSCRVDPGYKSSYTGVWRWPGSECLPCIHCTRQRVRLHSLEL